MYFEFRSNQELRGDSRKVIGHSLDQETKRRGTADGWITCSRFMGCGDRSIVLQKQYENPTNPAAGNRCETGTFSRNTAKSKRKGNRDVDQLSDADYVPTNTHSSQGESQLYIVEDNEAVIKLIFRGRSPTTRHVSGTHSGAIDSLYGRINLNSRILIKYVDIKNQVADVLTKGRFTRNEWNHLLCLLNIMNFSMFSCSHFFL